MVADWMVELLQNLIHHRPVPLIVCDHCEIGRLDFLRTCLVLVGSSFGIAFARSEERKRTVLR